MSTYLASSLSTRNAQPLGNPLWLYLKETIDRCGALCLLIVTAPVFLVLYIKTRADGGPAYYGQIRIGKNGKPFKCWKFRSMAVNSQELLKELLENDAQAREEWAKDFKLKNDPRITKIGHFLRKTSLDELPQLFNVLRGDMSLVGPRPVVKAERSYYGTNWHDYLSVKPGMTGLWQVSGRNNTTYARRVNLDMFYIRKWSLWLDIVIVFKTIGVVFNRRGAY